MAATSLFLPPLLSTTTVTAITTHNHNEQTTKPPLGSLKLCRNIKEIEQYHAHITKKGLSNDPSALVKLVAKYAEIATPESLQYARKAFKQINDHAKDGSSTVYMLNCLIRGYAFGGFSDEAIMLYVLMVVDGIWPDHYTYPFVLSACTKIEALCEGMQVHGSVVKMGLQEDVFIQNSLIHLYFECGEVDKGRKVFDEMRERNVVSWTSLICGCARKEREEEAVGLFFEMVGRGIRPNEVTMACVISACAKLGDLDLGERVCGYIGQFGVKENAVLVNALVDMYLNCGAKDKARELFEGCVGGNLVLYNTILSNYVHLGLAREALDILNEMLRLYLKPDRVTVLSAISATVEVGNLSFGRQCHGYILRNGLEGWDSVSNALIDMYMKFGKKELGCVIFDRMLNKTVVSWNSLIGGLIRNDDLEAARRMFNEMPESDLVSWNTILGALVQESLFEDAIEHFRAMQSVGIKADQVTMVSVASACGYLGALDLAKWTYRYVKNNNIHCDRQLSTALVDMFARCGDPQSAMLVFSRMNDRDVSAWTAAIGAMSMEGNGEGAVELFHKMISQGVEPDQVAFVGVLTACSHGGLVDQGMSIFQSMTEKHKISPQIVHYGCMVDLLGRAGLLNEALNLIKQMPLEPNDAVWGAFLAACRMHRDDKMAAYAADMMTESAREKTGINVLLSNIYASARKWTDVAKVRLNMKAMGIQKVPGSSSIDVNGLICEFTSGDQSQIDEGLLAPMLDELNCRLRYAGYVPELANVLLDVDQQEKEILLGQHSEKLAIAFGLISSGKGTPIRVVKNLRICSDCHAYAKLVSKIYDREIVIRDNNRFHVFKQGMCSCNDYW